MASINWTLTWTAVQALSAVVTTGIIIVAAIYAKRQLSEITLSRHAQVLDRIQAILGDRQVMAARTAVMNLPDNFDIASLTEEQRTQIEMVTRSFDRVGFYLWSGLIPREYVLPQYPGAIWHWRKLKHYIEEQRQTEGYEARIHFEHMARLTEEFRTSIDLPV